MIEVKNLVKRYGNHCAVDHLSFTVEDGHVFGLLGPNGAGKSTTMNILTGCLSATEGSVRIDGFDIFEERTKPVLEYYRAKNVLREHPIKKGVQDLPDTLRSILIQYLVKYN